MEDFAAWLPVADVAGVVTPASEVFFVVEFSESCEVYFWKGSVCDGDVFVCNWVTVTAEADVACASFDTFVFGVFGCEVV